MVTQTRTIENFDLLDEDETEEQVLADEAEWDAQFAATQDGLKKMADQVRADIRAGRTAPDDPEEFENDPRFLKRIEAARESLRLGRGVKIEDVEEQEQVAA